MEQALARSRRALFLGMRRGGAPSVATIAPSCLARRNTACMACRDACPTSAIRFTVASGGARPLVEATLCTSCGECVTRCPVGAIALAAAEAAHA
jgi:ferredoxin-type protein NapF